MAFSLEDTNIIVNYHYVEDAREDFSGIHPCSLEEFEKQVAFLSNNFDITSVSEVYSKATQKRQGRFCAFTFDDCLRDQIENAVPILKKYNASATFFLITKTLEGFVPHTHKVHSLLSRFSTEQLVEIYEKFLSTFSSDVVARYTVSKTKRLTLNSKMYDDVLTANLKEMMNILPIEIKDSFFNFVFKEFNLDESNLNSTLFMSSKDVQKLHQSGHTVGSHSHTHALFDTLSEDDILFEIQESKKILSELLDTPPSVFSYPQNAPKKGVVEQILTTAGFTHAVSIEERKIVPKDDIFFIPRFDSNSIKNFLST